MKLLISCFTFFLLFAKGIMGVYVLSTLICDKIDILILVDTTTTTGQYNSYRYIKNFLTEVIVTHDRSPVPLDTRVMVILTRQNLYLEFDVRGHTPVYNALRDVDLIRFVRWNRVADTYKTLSTYGFRQESTKTVVVVTDGVSRYCTRTEEAIRLAKRQGLKVFAFGVGSSPLRRVLESVASLPSYQFAIISRNFYSPRCANMILAWTRPTAKVTRSYRFSKYTTRIPSRTSTRAFTCSKCTRSKNSVYKTTKKPLQLSTSTPITKVTSKGPRINYTTSLTRVYPKYTTVTPLRTSSEASTFEKITKSKHNEGKSTTSFRLLSTTAFTEVTSTYTTENKRNTSAIVTKSKDVTTTSFETPLTTAFTEVTSTYTTEDERNTSAIVTKSKDVKTTSFETPLTTAFTEVTSTYTTEDERNTSAIVTKSKDVTTTSFETPLTTAFTKVTSPNTTEDERNTSAIVTKSKDVTTTSFETPSTTAFTKVTSPNTTEDERNTSAIVTKSKDVTTASFETPSTTAFTEKTSPSTTEDERNTSAIVTKSKDVTTTSFKTPSTTPLTKVTSTDTTTEVLESTTEDFYNVEPN